ncbi:MAG TPA: 50S ribosomal protein L18 [Flavobacteriales bacterium]|jgi:large subunit ribosomal protein L18|nr:50S ribosomal protein L18 [Flavobacteriales bacterium]
MSKSKAERREKIRRRVRSKIKGTADRPRLAVYRSNKEIYANIVDDVSGTTLVAATSLSKEGNNSSMNKVDQAKELGKEVAKLAAEKNIVDVVFDRSGYLYHGRVKALAEGAREGGLKF